MSRLRHCGTPGRGWSGVRRQDDDLAGEGAGRGTGVDRAEVGHRNALGNADGELAPVHAGGELTQLCGVAADEQVDAAYAAGLVGRGGHPHGGVDDDPTLADDAPPGAPPALRSSDLYTRVALGRALDSFRTAFTASCGRRGASRGDPNVPMLCCLRDLP